MLDLKQNFDVLEKIVINYILGASKIGDITDENNNVIDRVKLVRNIDRDFFRDATIYDIFTVIKSNVVEYGKIPSPNEIWSELTVNNIDVDKEEFDVILGYPLETHNKKVLYKYIRGFLLMLNLNQGLQQMMTHLKSSATDFNRTDEVYEYVRTHINEVIQIDITDTGDGLDVFEANSHIQPTKTTRPTGFPFLDKVLGGGWEKGTLVVFQGRPKVGKCAIHSTRVTVRNKKTKEMETITLGKLRSRLSQ